MHYTVVEEGVYNQAQHGVTTYSITGFASTSSAVVSQVAMDGGNGGWGRSLTIAELTSRQILMK